MIVIIENKSTTTKKLNTINLNFSVLIFIIR